MRPAPAADERTRLLRETQYNDNAHLKVRLHAGKEYPLRLRLRYAKKPGQAAVMVW